jgi:DNA topoisomerase II
MDSKNQLAKKYKKLDHREHVLQRPNMYIGNVDQDTCLTWVLSDTEENKMIQKELTYVPGLYKIFDEILVNAIDHSIRLKMNKEDGSTVNLVKNIKVNIEQDTGYIEVYNDGDGIDIEKHPEHHIYIPELIFGHLLTSTNYDDKKERVIGGMNGLGAKACNIFSKHFVVETVDSKRKKLYKQEFCDNMSKRDDPKITSCAKKPYTLFRFLPDYEKFKMKSLSKDMYDLMVKRVYDACAVTEGDVNVYLNDKKLDYKNFEKYVDLYLGSKSEHCRVYEKIDDRWEVVASFNDEGGFQQISFVNGIWTIRGGKHVDYICNQLLKKLIDIAQKKKKDLSIKPQYIKDNLILFLKSTIVNPNFDSQTKETLTTPFSKFGSKPEISDKFVEKMYKSGIIEKAINIGTLLDTKTAKKTDGKKKSTITGIPSLDDANWAGTSKSRECTLILTEGLSAKTMAIAGISVVGRDKWGVFPLRGKVMNVKDTAAKKIYENQEIANLKKILGLESGREYESLDDLRYGRVMLMTDQDTDGSHIKGLIFNLFHSLWPSLMRTDGFEFICSMLTPIVKVFKGKDIKKFYSLPDFESWRKDNNNGNGWTVKYYKGLGTSTEQEAIEYFTQMKNVTYKWTTTGEKSSPSDESMDLAFNKSRADDRKEWLANYNRTDVVDYRDTEVSYEDFINKELIHFSNYDLERSIPSMCDGFKVSQRKILYGCLKKPLWEKEIRVAQLASYVSETSAYHHGEASLQMAITGMAQDFVGSNNINLLRPNGQFGTRIHGGKDASSPRYIYTLLHPLTKVIFNKDDNDILKHLDDDGFPVEPEFYLPIIPMILVNGTVGIGTGFSTNIPCYNPKDIVETIKNILNGKEVDYMNKENDLKPYYHGFQGKIDKLNGKWHSRGCYNRSTATKVEITELPVGVWTADFKELLEDMVSDKEGKYKNFPLKSYESHYSAQKVKFVLHFTSSASLETLMKTDDNGLTKLETELKLCTTKTLGTTNMYAFNEKGQITKFETAKHIIYEFVHMRMIYYKKRKEQQLDRLGKEINKLNNKIRFVLDVISNKIAVYKMKKVELEERLKELEFDMYDNSYDYLTKIPIYNFTTDKVKELQDEIKNKEVTIAELETLTESHMWMTDIEEFEKVYTSYIEERNKKNDEKGKGKISKYLKSS